jgi:hypothetical protein
MYKDLKNKTVGQLTALKYTIEFRLQECKNSEDSLAKAAIPFYTEYLENIRLAIANKILKKKK